jgi:hypothetical protein
MPEREAGLWLGVVRFAEFLLNARIGADPPGRLPGGIRQFDLHALRSIEVKPGPMRRRRSTSPPNANQLTAAVRAQRICPA